jgi:hypothetical protein
MAFPHPQSRKDQRGQEDKPNSKGVFWDFFKRAVNITEDRDAQNEVNTAKYRTFGGVIHGWIVDRFVGEAA